jgi:activating signal cointegrator 1
MKALTMTQPWATLVALGENSIETRSWSTRHRGPLAIHSAKGFPADARELCEMSPYREVLARAGYRDASELPRGEIIAVATLVDVMKFKKSTLKDIRARAARGEFPRHEADFGDFSAGRFGWILKDVVRLKDPIPAKGMLGLWEFECSSIRLYCTERIQR